MHNHDASYLSIANFEYLVVVTWLTRCVTPVHANRECTIPPTGIVGPVTTELIPEAWIWNWLVTDVAVYRNTRVYDTLLLARCP